MGVLLTLIAGLVVWIVLWAIGFRARVKYSGSDAFRRESDPYLNPDFSLDDATPQRGPP